MKRKIILILAAVMMVMLALSACTKKPTTTATATPAPTSEATATPKKNFMKAGDVYRYYRWDFTTENSYFEEEGAGGDYIRATKAAMEEEYGITITCVPGKPGDWFGPVIESAYAGTPEADVFHIGGPPWIIGAYAYNGMPESAIQSLTDLSEAATFSDPEFWDVDAQNSTCTFGGELYFANPASVGWGQIAVNQVTYFNKRIIEGAGYTSEQLYGWNNSGDWTWDRYRQLLVDTTNADAGVFGTLLGQSGGFLYGLVASNNASFIAYKEVDGKQLYQLATTDPKAIAAYEFFASIAHDGLIDTSNGTAQEATYFASGKYATMLTYLNRTDGTTGLSTIMEDDYGIIQIPKGPSATTYVSDTNWNGPICILQNIENSLGAAQFLEMFLAPQYGKSSEQAVASLQADLESRVRDEESLQVCLAIPQYSKSSAFMVYMNQLGNEVFGTGNLLDMASGATTPTTYFASIEASVNQKLLDAQIYDTEG